MAPGLREESLPRSKIGVKQLIVAFHKPKNLKELLFKRKYEAEEEQPASTFGHIHPIDNDRILQKLSKHESAQPDWLLGNNAEGAN